MNCKLAAEAVKGNSAKACMRKQLFIIAVVVLYGASVVLYGADYGQDGGGRAEIFAGQDLHLAAGKVVSHQPATGEHTLVLTGGFSMSIGANHFTSDSAVVWLVTELTQFRGRVGIDYTAKVYLEGNVAVQRARNAMTTDLRREIITAGQAEVVRFTVTGEVFVTAQQREFGDPKTLALYQRAIGEGPAVLPQEAVKRRPAAEPEKKEFIHKKAPAPAAEDQIAAAEDQAEPAKQPQFRYPVYISPVGEVRPTIEVTKQPDGTDVATLMGRFYIWQQQDESGRLLELEADTAVIYYSSQQVQVGAEQTGTPDVLAQGAVRDVYIAGDAVITEGRRTIRADELYYDFERKKAIAVNAVMRNFDIKRGIPIYVRAGKLRQVAENKFSGEDMTLTSSEFYQPQISLTSSQIYITDTTVIDEQAQKVSDRSFDAEMRDVRMKVGKQTVFYWPVLRGNLERPDIPVKSVHVGKDNTWGTSIETRWYLSRLLGLKEPEDVDATLATDFYSKRGFGMGVGIDYERPSYYGHMIGYIINDRGQDRLGRAWGRKHVDPQQDLRGRFSWLHRQFLPYNWQLTASVGYASDEFFVESYYRDEFSASGRQKTYLHLKRIEDNWGLGFAGAARINDFADELEELPSAEFHLTGESVFKDTATLYSDSRVGRFRQRIGKNHSIAMDQDHYTFMSHRTELDMPIGLKIPDSKSQAGSFFKAVPFVAGTFGYDDRSGFTRSLVDGSGTGVFGEKQVWLGEAGIRIVPPAYWKVYDRVKSRLWDLNRLRHIIRPELTAVLYAESDDVVRQRDTVNFGISQRLQTKRKRGPAFGDEEETIDWMALDVDFTWVRNSEPAHETSPDRFIWNKPIVPLSVFSAPEIFNGDLRNAGRFHRFEMFGPRRNYFSADYIWRASDGTAILSDLNFDMQSSVVQQFDIGLSRLQWPNLSWYIGSRYLRRIEVGNEKGSNMFTFAATYKVDPRYTLVFAQQYDFDYGANIRSDITLVRRYHRIYCGITYSTDHSLDRQAIVFSIWPQGIPELAIGQRRYIGLGGSAVY